MAKKDAESKSDKKADKKRKGRKGGDEVAYSSIATHPRARTSVRRVKAWFGLGGFVLAALLSIEASVPFIQVGERALITGIVGYLVGWWLSMLAWRHLMLAEQRAAVEEIERRRREDSEAKAEKA